MKLLPLLGCILMLTTASTCHNDDDDAPIVVNPTNNNATAVANTAQQGTWRITYFYDTDHEDTAHFTNYTFTFAQNGVLTAANGTNTYTGSWSVTNDHDGDDDDSGNHSSNDVDFNVFFSSPNDFAELSEDWDIVTYNANRIELIHVSGGNGGTDHLVFEKN